MRKYTIQKVGENVDWSGIPILNIDSVYKVPCEHLKAWAQIAYDHEAILVHLFTDEKNIRAEEHGLLGSPWEDSCLEFFFSPMEGDSRYFNIEFNTNGCQFLGMGSGVDDLVRLLPLESGKSIFKPEINVKEAGWEIYYRVPYRFIKCFFPEFEAVSGKKIRANCFKCGDYTEIPHYLTWNPIGEGKSTFHRPDSFGEMFFE